VVLYRENCCRAAVYFVCMRKPVAAHMVSAAEPTMMTADEDHRIRSLALLSTNDGVVVGRVLFGRVIFVASDVGGIIVFHGQRVSPNGKMTCGSSMSSCGSSRR
jgi:hypothetical protein